MLNKHAKHSAVSEQVNKSPKRWKKKDVRKWVASLFEK